MTDKPQCPTCKRPLPGKVGRPRTIAEPLRKWILEAHADGLSYAKIGAAIDIPTSTVQSICDRAKKNSLAPPTKMS